ncbi:hypothetical protein KSD_94020 [Ktedonobacter sp. SOSP1-85]|uniref:citrate synthase family protein n=1 Tax=Ktedonobacter sp. SOSP1-85 TaxID=2778367 RepID=UPI001914E007|nr:citrate synthase family protein [Ktedonobacter sp. SOSP1-85]GHO81631.1 hypothetical protein KSD_94020 [Ktedonobacter sp. SOSP1-85]
MTQTPYYVTAQEAAEMLQVRVETIYAYVSRGLLRSEPGSGKQRARLYRVEDVQRLQEKKSYRQDPSSAATGAMHWGMPVLKSALTLISENGVYYRGENVVQLALSESIERVASLLWHGESGPGERFLLENTLPVATYLQQLHQLAQSTQALQRLSIALTLASADDIAAYDLDPSLEQSTQIGARILYLMASVLTQAPQNNLALATMLQRRWCPEDERTTRLFNAALILCADHELNASSFVAHVVASAQSSLYQVVIAGLATLQGFRHGGVTWLVERFLQEVEAPQQANTVITARLKRGEQIPAFGHKLYPSGDPRAIFLLDLLKQMYPDASSLQCSLAIIETMSQLTGKLPTLDFALVTMAQTLELPPDSALALFALGRSVGWIAHALEQYADGQLIRPRAQYTGLLPDSSAIQKY